MGHREVSREGTEKNAAIFEHSRVSVGLKGRGFCSHINHPHIQSIHFLEQLSATGQVMLRVGAAGIQAWPLSLWSLWLSEAVSD